MFPLHDPVCALLETPFSSWNPDHKKDFLSSKRPTPLLKIDKVTKIKNKIYNRKFKKSWYLENEWLCGSYYLTRLFCLPCLTTCVKSSVWNKNGFRDFANVTRAINKHEGSAEHMRSALAFSKLNKKLTTVDDAVKENSRLFLTTYNENVQRNRCFMKLPIRAVLLLGKQGLLFRGHHENASAFIEGNFKQLLEEFISISPVDIQDHYKKIKPVFAGNYRTIQNEIIDCISQYIDEYVENEIKHCKFFSVQVDDSTDIVQKSQCSIVLRYVNSEGQLIERFLGFYDVSSSRTSETLFNLVSECLGKFHFTLKLVGQCYDGASVMPGQFSGLQAKIKEVAPKAVFVHSLAHRLSLVLQQTCNRISKCRIFFAIVSSLPSFFHHFVKRIQMADPAAERRIPTSLATRWTSNSKILSVVYNEWNYLKQVFLGIRDDPTSDQASISQSNDFLRQFDDFEFALLTVVFNHIFELTDELFEVLQKNSLDINLCMSHIRHTQTLLSRKINEETFTEMFDLAAAKAAVPSEHHEAGEIFKLTRDEVFERYKVLYDEILDTIYVQTNIRFRDMERLKFITLMDTSKFVQYSEEFPIEAFSDLNVYYSNIFTNIQRLKNELQLIYGDEQFANMNLQTFMDVLSENGNVFKEASKLLSLIMTIPSTSVSTDESFSCLKRIKSLPSNTMAEGRFSNLSKISIEKQLLKELVNKEPFYEDIIDKFASLSDRRIDLIFKK